jgi:hypothetical protein
MGLSEVTPIVQVIDPQALDLLSGNPMKRCKHTKQRVLVQTASVFHSTTNGCLQPEWVDEN